jgi:hypothetical protein
VKGGDDGGDGLIFCLHRMDKVGEGGGRSGKCSYNRFKYLTLEPHSYLLGHSYQAQNRSQI